MNFEEQLLVGALLLAIAIFSATHAHARPVKKSAAPVVRIAGGPPPARLL
jgi:hypothetical protein